MTQLIGKCLYTNMYMISVGVNMIKKVRPFQATAVSSIPKACAVFSIIGEKPFCMRAIVAFKPT